ncbi:MAG: hypothetical protein D6724_01095 [Armatimonadetes bacterium]|nr:MAG: hypothetical protein D6724_01095 [Armatimonadota bacterium]
MRIGSIHPHVPHPKEKMHRTRGKLEALNERILDWVSEHILASIIMFDIALVVPLLAIPLSDTIKITLGVVSGSWIQWWALHALQRGQIKAERQRAAKADADHEALSHIAIQVDRIAAMLESERGQA